MPNELLPLAGEVLPRPRRTDLALWALAIVVGLTVGFLIVSFRTIVAYTEIVFYGATGARLAAKLADLSPLHRLFAPIVGGSIVALILRAGVWSGWGPAPRPFGLDHVVAARRMRTTVIASTLSLRDSLLSLLAAIVSLGSGASAGREEPAAHAGASLAMLPGRLLGLDPPTRRFLIAAGVAAAIAAILHAPIAAIILVRQLMLPRQRLSTMAPLVLASVAGWLTSRAMLGDNPVIDIPDPGLIPAQFHLFAFVLTPLFAAIAWASLRFWRWSEDTVLATADRHGAPVWMLPFAGGLFLGLICLVFPPVMGIGYGPVSASLGGGYSALIMPVLIFAKIAASSITFSFRFGGGPIAPMIFIGAMTGATLGVFVGLPLGDAAAGQTYFGLVGIGVMLAILLRSPLFAGVLILELSVNPASAAGAIACAYLAVYLAERFTPRLYEERPETQPLH